MNRNYLPFVFVFSLVLTLAGYAQKDKAKTDTLMQSSTFAGLEFRSVGPAFMSGRIADIAIHPEDESTWYVAVGSGGIWKTENSGTTWTPIFDKQTSYSIGCLAIDPSNQHVVWAGTGENVGGRHVGYGDGIYRSDDGGSSWTNMGLKESNHISKIIIHPKNPEIIWVAAQGPLWYKGGERGVFKSSDGGKSWKQTLGDNEWVGATDLVIDPRNPDLLYAATWQRHRNVAAYMSSGPGSGIHRSTDGGNTWEKLTKGLPTTNMGKIGLAISPQKPDILYAAIELNRRSGGVFKSENRGSSWVQQSEAVSGATGPHYYQELVACPHNFDKLYLMDVRIQVSEDGGKTFKRLNEQYKHSDNHALVFRENDPDYLLAGTDGGLYESFDDAQNWRHIRNLPVTQFYKVAVDDAKPFYNIYGGTQDNSTQGGPSRTDNRHGIRNADWFLTLGGDGHQPATEPGNPNIVYSESQEGYLHRTDRATGEVIFIQPQPDEGEDYERFNWDSPILVSPHKPARIYFASQRVWKSENRGDSWEAISKDLSKNEERFELPIMGKTQSWDAAWDFEAMSTYNTITSLAESPIQEGLIYAGTDDGIIQVTEDGGKNWRKIMVNKLPGVPATAFVNDIKADLYDANTVYVVLDNHKFGDLNPYLYKSTDRGVSWQKMGNNLPERTLLWRIVQDHEQPGLFFLATEFGIWFSVDAGNKWTQLKGGLPTISFRDLVIQKQANDLVCASFGRGFYILDDLSPLRKISEEKLKENALLFKPRKAWWYIERPVISFGEKGSRGADYFNTPNPPYGAVFTYYLKESKETVKAQRQKKEKELAKENANIPFPGWDALEKERRQEGPEVFLFIKDMKGNQIRRISGPASSGFHRVSWNLRYPSKRAIDPDRTNDYERNGFLAAPGTYTVTLAVMEQGVFKELSKPQQFEVVPLHEGTLKGSEPAEVAAFWRKIEDVMGQTSAASNALNNAINRVNAMQAALERTTLTPGTLDSSLVVIKNSLYDLQNDLQGDQQKREVGEKTGPTILQRIGVATSGTRNSTYGPTPLHLKSLEIGLKEFDVFKKALEDIRQNKIPALEKQLVEAGAPWIEGQPLPE